MDSSPEPHCDFEKGGKPEKTRKPPPPPQKGRAEVLTVLKTAVAFFFEGMKDGERFSPEKVGES